MKIKIPKEQIKAPITISRDSFLAQCRMNSKLASVLLKAFDATTPQSLYKELLLKGIVTETERIIKNAKTF